MRKNKTLWRLSQKVKIDRDGGDSMAIEKRYAPTKEDAIAIFAYYYCAEYYEIIHGEITDGIMINSLYYKDFVNPEEEKKEYAGWDWWVASYESNYVDYKDHNKAKPAWIFNIN